MLVQEVQATSQELDKLHHARLERLARNVHAAERFHTQISNVEAPDVRRRWILYLFLASTGTALRGLRGAEMELEKPHRMLPRLRNRLRVEQEVVPVGHPAWNGLPS